MYTIFVSLACTHDRMHVHNVRDFHQAKLENEIYAHFLLNEHGEPHFLMHEFKLHKVIYNTSHAFKKALLMTVIKGLVFSKMFYCSSVWSNTSTTNINKLQAIQNFAARIVTRSRKFDHITPILKQLRWIPVKDHLF